MADTFISYSRKDIAFAKIVHDSLKKNGIETWIDWQDIPPAVDWFDEVKEAIEHSDTFVFIISPNSIQSEICSDEIAHAELNNKRLIPIVIGDIDPQKVPSTLQPLNWIFFKEEDQKYAKALNDLVTALTLDQPWMKAHTRIQNRALEWKRCGKETGYLLHGADLEEAEKWLAQAAGKDPDPTALQTEYILASRTQATRRQRRTLIGVVVGLVVAIVLGVLAWNQRNIAVSEGQMRATAQMEAEEEAHSRATQQAIAEEQRIIAESKGLAAQSMSKQNQTHYDVALLLGVEALKKQVNNETKSAMLHALMYDPKLERYLNVDETSDIFEVATNSDFTQIAVAGDGGKVHVLDPVTGLLEYPPIDLGDLEINNIKFSPDDSIIAISAGSASPFSSASPIYLLNATTGALEYSLSVPENTANGTRTYAVGFISDRVLVSLGMRRLYFWDVLSGEILNEKIIDIGYRMSVSHDKSMIVVGSSQDFHLFDVQSGEQMVNKVIDFRTSSLNVIKSISFSADDKSIVFGTAKGEVVLYDIKTKTKSNFSLFHDDRIYVNNVRFAGKSVLVSADENYIYFWNSKTGDRLIKWHYDGIDQFLKEYKDNLIISPDNQTLIVGESSGRISLYSIWTRPDMSVPFEYMDFKIENLNISSTGDYVYTVISEPTDNSGYEKVIVSWNVSTGQIASDKYFTGYPVISEMEISPDDNLIAYIGRDVGLDESVTNIWFVDLREWEIMDQTFHFEDNRSIEDIYFFPTGNLLAIISEEHDLLTYDYKNDKIIAGPLKLGDYPSPLQKAPEIIVSRDGKRILVSEGDHVIHMYDSDTLKPTGVSFTGHLDTINTMDISPKDKYLVSIGEENQLILWNLITGEVISKLSNLSNNYYRGSAFARFSPDGSMVAVVYDDLLQFFDVPSLDPIGPPLIGNIRNLNSSFFNTDPLLSFGGTFEPEPSFVFSPDGTKLLVGGEDNMRLIILSASEWIERACFLAGRNLTKQEWQTYLPYDGYQKTCPQYP
ncbi:TIR domain-containing protein [bacterium]|nr:TIR domain-containing protein [bacterium]